MAELEEKTTKSKKTFLPEVIKERTYKFELVGDSKPRNYGISSQCIVYDPVSQKEVQIRYVPGWESILVSEQPDIEERLRPHADINFSNGFMQVPGIKKQLVQFLLVHDKLEDNQLSTTKIAQFKVVDNTQNLKDIRDVLNKQSKAVDMAEKAPFEEVVPFAKVLGMTTYKQPGEKQGEYEDRVRTEFMQRAADKPADFIEGFEDPAHKREYDIILGFEQGVITDTLKNREVNWVKSGEKITDLPPSAGKTIKYLTKFTYQEKGGEFYSQLKKQVKY